MYSRIDKFFNKDLERRRFFHEAKSTFDSIACAEKFHLFCDKINSDYRGVSVHERIDHILLFAVLLQELFLLFQLCHLRIHIFDDIQDST